jgi:hypothetical protein
VYILCIYTKLLNLTTHVHRKQYNTKYSCSLLRHYIYVNFYMTPIHANTHKKTPREIHFIYLDIEEVYCTFKTCSIISVLFSTKGSLFHNCIFLCSNNTLFVNQVLKLPYQPSCLKVKPLTRDKNYDIYFQKCSIISWEGKNLQFIR